MTINLAFDEEGSGEVLILLHGNGEDRSYFVHQIKHFAKNYCVVALDTRGHGSSPRGEAPFTIRQFASDLLAFMNAKHIARAHLLGFSDGGNIALAFALAHPERVDKLVLNGANLDGRGVKRRVQVPVYLAFHLASLLGRFSAGARKHAELLGLMVNDPHINPAQLRELTVKTLVIAGTHDVIKESHTRLMGKSLPNAQLVFIPGGHFIAQKNSAAFNRAVSQFLAGP